MSEGQDRQRPDDEHQAGRLGFEQQMSSLSIRAPSLYRKLSGSEIRLIKIGPGDWDDPISCELFHVPLDERPKYVALSYAWGNSWTTRPITLNGKPYRITKNLFRGLRRLRNMISATDKNNETFITDSLEDFRLWADAICINQEDEEEKSRQIARMSDIYKLADRVYVWLGENKEDERSIVFRIMGMAHCFGLASQPWEDYLNHLFDRSSEDFDTFAEGFAKLLSRPWFTRIWVIQEVCLPAKPLMLAGGAWSYMDSLLGFFRVIFTYNKQHRPPEFSTIISLDKFLNFYGFSQLRDRCQSEIKDEATSEIDSSSLGARLILALRFTEGSFQAAVPHDHIYGLLGLVSTTALPPPLTPDYTKPYAIVYQEYARFIVEHIGSLDILCRVQCDITGLPSWVPDFRSSTAYVVWGKKILLSHPISFTDDGNRMVLMGVELGFCEHVYIPPSRKDIETDPIFLAGIKRFDNFLSKISDVKHLSKDGILEDWLNLERKLQQAKELSIEDIKHFYYSIIHDEQVNGDQQSSHIKDFLCFSVGFYSIFITEDRVLASLSRLDLDAQPGDVMIAVEGARFPILLRPTTEPSEYEFLGACKYSQILRGSSEAAFENRVLKEFVIV